jgi:hypothetical protein
MTEDEEYKQNRILVDRVQDLRDLAARQIRNDNKSLKSFVQALISTPDFAHAEIKHNDYSFDRIYICYKSFETPQEYKDRIKLVQKIKIREEIQKAERLRKYLELKAEFEQ